MIFRVVTLVRGGVLLSKVLPIKENHRIMFQDAVIDTIDMYVREVGQTFQFVQLQIGGNNHEACGSDSGVDDKNICSIAYSVLLSTPRLLKINRCIYPYQQCPITRKYFGHAIVDGQKIYHQHHHIPVQSGAEDAAGKNFLLPTLQEII